MHHNLISIPALGQLADNSTQGITITELDPPLQLILVHHAGQRFVYLDSCPHTGVNLSWKPDQYYDYHQHYLQCSTHGALFRIHDGLCVSGPCHGTSLTPLKIHQSDGLYYVDVDPLI